MTRHRGWIETKFSFTLYYNAEDLEDLKSRGFRVFKTFSGPTNSLKKRVCKGMDDPCWRNQTQDQWLIGGNVDILEPR